MPNSAAETALTLPSAEIANPPLMGTFRSYATITSFPEPTIVFGSIFHTIAYCVGSRPFGNWSPPPATNAVPFFGGCRSFKVAATYARFTAFSSSITLISSGDRTILGGAGLLGGTIGGLNLLCCAIGCFASLGGFLYAKRIARTTPTTTTAPPPTASGIASAREGGRFSWPSLFSWCEADLVPPHLPDYRNSAVSGLCRRLRNPFDAFLFGNFLLDQDFFVATRTTDFPTEELICDPQRFPTTTLNKHGPIPKS